MGDVNNGIAVHSLKTGHSIAWDKAKITDRETHWQRRRVKEAIRIQKTQVRMNLDQGIVLHQAVFKRSKVEGCTIPKISSTQL